MNLKTKIRIRKKAIKSKIKIIRKNVKKQDKLESLVKYILKKPKRFINKIKNSKTPIRDIIRFILGSRIAIIIFGIILYLKAQLFYEKISLEINWEKPEITNLMTIAFITILVCPLLFIKKEKNRFRTIIIMDILLSRIITCRQYILWIFINNVINNTNTICKICRRNR